MQVIEWQEFAENGLSLNGKLSSMTVGVFDGIHLGHRSLLSKILSHKDKVPVVITFRKNIDRKKNSFLIMPFNEKLAMLENLGIKITVAIDFTESFEHLAGKDFLDILCKRGSIGFFAVGSNFRCGYKLDTDAEAIKDYFTERNIIAEIENEVMEGDLPISSNRIRRAIENGDMNLAERMLGRKS